MSHGVIKTTYWSDKKVKAWPDDAKLLGAYFITGPHRNILGCARIPNGYLMDDLGWDAKRLARAIAVLVETNFIARDDDGWTLLLNQLKHDPLKHTNHVKGAIKILAQVPADSPVYQAAHIRLAEVADALGIPLAGLAEPMPAPAPSPSPSPSPMPQTPAPSPAKSAPTAPTAEDELGRVLDSERAKAVIEHRKNIRKPLTAHAAKLLAGKFARCRDGPNAAADAMISNGWQGFEPEWLEKRGSNGQRKPSDLDNRRATVDAIDEVVRMAEARLRSVGTKPDS